MISLRLEPVAEDIDGRSNQFTMIALVVLLITGVVLGLLLSALMIVLNSLACLLAEMFPPVIVTPNGVRPMSASENLEYTEDCKRGFTY